MSEKNEKTGMLDASAAEQSSVDTPAQADGQNAVQGRSVFAVETTAAGVAVQTVFLTSEGALMPMPAVFPTLEYAYGQIDELRRMVGQHFAQAAQVGVQVIAARAGAAASKAGAETHEPQPHEPHTTVLQ